MFSVFIIIGLYALFLGDVNVKSVKSVTGDVKGIRFLVDSWIMAGIIVVNSITVTLGVFGTIIEDENKKRLNGFLVAPVSRSKLVAGYLFASWVVGIILCMLTIILAELYIISSGGTILPPAAILKVLGLTVLSVFSSSSMVFFLISFVKTSSGFSTLSTILGTIIGFITGIYIPIGTLPEAVQTVIKFVPASHTVALMRQVFMEKPIGIVFNNAPKEAVDSYLRVFGVKILAGGSELSTAAMLSFVALTGVVFLILSIFRMNRRKMG